MGSLVLWRQQAMLIKEGCDPAHNNSFLGLAKSVQECNWSLGSRG
jgi:hypothetical protein